MAKLLLRKHLRVASLGLGGLVAIVGVQTYLKFRPVADSASYRLLYHVPEGWVDKPTPSGSLFLYIDPKRKLAMKGAMLSLISDTNPNPQDDTDELVGRYQTLTKDRMPNWTSETLEPVKAAGVEFGLVRRTGPNRYSLIALCVHGNSTFSVVMYSDADHSEQVRQTEPWFRSYVASLALEKEDPNLILRSKPLPGLFRQTLER